MSSFYIPKQETVSGFFYDSLPFGLRQVGEKVKNKNDFFYEFLI
jgi:hypothetical protein